MGSASTSFQIYKIFLSLIHFCGTIQERRFKLMVTNRAVIIHALNITLMNLNFHEL